MTDTTILEVDSLAVNFTSGQWLLRSRRVVRAVRGVTFRVGRGETLALVGESGSGKTTVAKTVMGFHRPTAGVVRIGGADIAGLGAQELRQMRRRVQYVFQDPYASLPRSMTVRQIVEEPLTIHRVGDRAARRSRTGHLLDLVRLPANLAGRYPHELSGGQRQRVGIARALALQPELLVLDEPVSALDVSVQAVVINLLAEIQQELEVAYLFVAHDLAVVRHLSDRVAVMNAGCIVETGTTHELFNNPAHPYTRTLLAAVPVLDPDRGRLRADDDQEAT